MHTFKFGDQLAKFRDQIAAFGEECIGGNMVGHFSRAILSTHRDHRDLRKAVAQNGHEFITGHDRHPQIGNDHIGKRFYHPPQRIDAVLG